jgi:hypothetical protein
MLSLGRPPAQTVNTFWGKIGAWNMTGMEAKGVSMGGIAHGNIVGVTAIIYSDAVNGKVEVDRLDRSGFGEPGGPVKWSRGGFWQVASSTTTLQLYRGPIPQTGPSDPTRNRFTQGFHVGAAENRGWYRIDYLGAPVNASQPYAIKTKVLTLGAWDMTALDQVSVNLGQYGKPANRVSCFQVTLKSNDGIYSSDIIRIGPSGSNGGVGYITDKLSPIQAVLLNRKGIDDSYFTNDQTFWNYQGAGNRGHIKIDYSAAECGEGSGYTRSYIGFTPGSTDCHGNNGSGTSAIHVVQTQGADIWNTADKFAFISKPSGAANSTVKVRVDRIENTNAWARSGLMFRSSLAANARHVSMVVTPKPATGNGNGIGLTVRAADGGATTEVSPNTFSAPYWVLIQKTGNSFKGYASATGVGDPVANPSAWNQVGATTTVAFPTNYYVGMCQTAGNNSPAALNTSVYSNVGF